MDENKLVSIHFGQKISKIKLAYDFQTHLGKKSPSKNIQLGQTPLQGIWVCSFKQHEIIITPSLNSIIRAAVSTTMTIDTLNISRMAR